MGKHGLVRNVVRWAVVAGVVLAGSLAGQGQVAAQEVRIATLAPDNSTWMKLLEKAGQDIATATAGRVTHKYYASAVQGDERDVVRKMKLGQLDGAVLTGTGLSLIDESIRVLELPMLFRDVDELDFVRNKMWKHFRKRFAARGFELGEPGDVGYVHFFSNSPVRSLDDLKNAKVWMWTDDRVVRAVYKKLGINGVPLGVPDVLTALQTSRINACYNSPLGAVALQWNTKVRYVTSMPMTYAIGASVTVKKVADKASAADRQAIRKIDKKSSKKIRKTVRKDNKRAAKAMARNGVKTIESPPALIANFEKASQEVWNALAGKVYSKEQLDMVLKYRAEYRAKGGK